MTERSGVTEIRLHDVGFEEAISSTDAAPDYEPVELLALRRRHDDEPDGLWGSESPPSAPPTPVRPPSGRLSFGWDVLPVTEAVAPPEWCSYAAASRRPCCLLVLVCSFRPERPEGPETPAPRASFLRATLDLSLRCEGDGAAWPIARRIDPAERTKPVAGTLNGSGLSFSLSAGVIGVGVERPVEAVAATRDEWMVRGHGASQPDPGWEFRALKRAPLVGDQPVAALVETVPGRENRAAVSLSAELEHTRWGITRYRARLAPALGAIALPA